jgi:hypothetical protein
LGQCFSENPADFPRVRFPFAILVAYATTIELLKQADFCSTFWNKMMLNKSKVEIIISVAKQEDILLTFFEMSR